MNWPALTSECTGAVEVALRSAVAEKPTNLLEHVAEQLVKMSGLDPVAFEKHFEECKRKPRVYALEERCPANQDPLSWVPMRYRDKTILSSLQVKAQNLGEAIIAEEPIGDLQVLDSYIVSAYPEIMYVREMPEEVECMQTARAFYFLASPVADEELMAQCTDANPLLAFNCERMIAGARKSGFLNFVAAEGSAMLDVLFVSRFLRIVGGSSVFLERYGGGHINDPKQGILHCIEHEPKALPSYQRLNDFGKKLVVAALRSHVSPSSLVRGEALPANIAHAKDAMAPYESVGPSMLAALLITEHIVFARTEIVLDEEASIACSTAQGVHDIQKHPPQRVYDTLLKRRAERHRWRLVRDDPITRALVRLCCMLKDEEQESWEELKEVYEALPDGDLQLLVTELGTRDGVLDCPALVLENASDLMHLGVVEGGIGLTMAMKILVEIIQQACNHIDRTSNEKTIALDFSLIPALFQEGGAYVGKSFETMSFDVQASDYGSMYAVGEE